MSTLAILRDGIRDNNPGLVQLLGLCPLLAVSTSLVNGLALGLATLAVLVTSNAAAALVGRWLPAEIRIGVFVVLIAGLVTAVELGMAAWLPGMRVALGIFLPLIVTNCLVLTRAESFATHQPLGRALLDGIAMGVGFLLVLLALGATRELLGHGTLGADLHLLVRESAGAHGLRFFDERHGVQLALLPAGAFILLGLMIAVRNALRQRAAARASSRTTAAGGAPA